MADEVTFEMEGAEALEAKLRGLSFDMRFKGGRFALRRAANLVRDDAKRRAERFDDPDTGQKIADNITVRWSGKHFDQTDDLMFRIGVKGGGKTRGSPADTGVGGATPHFRLLELGTENMPAQPFLRPALAENIQQASDEFVTQYRKALDRALKRAAKKGK